PAAAAPAASVDPDEVMRRLNQAKDVSPVEIESMFDAMFKKAEEYAYRDAEFGDEADAETPAAAAAIQPETPDWLQEMMVQSPPAAPLPVADVEAQMADVLAGLEAPPAAAASAADMPDWLQESAPAAAAPVAAAVAEMPDWLQETAPAAAAPVAEESDMPDWLLAGMGMEIATEAAPAEPADIPDWLQDATPETGDIRQDIFAAEAAPAPAAAVPADFVMDAGDPWVVALTQEAENQEQLALWYARKTGQIPDVEAAPVIAAAAPFAAPAAGAGSRLQVAQFPVETELQEGTIEPVPDWLTGEEIALPAVTAFTEDSAPDWLTTTDETDSAEAMPDWLVSGIDDAIVTPDVPGWLESETGSSDDAFPDWLNVDAVETETDIPDWLRETMQEGEPVAAPPAPLPAVAGPPAPPRSPVPVAPAAAIDVGAALQSARRYRDASDLDSALRDYEAVVRANSQLQDVVDDLSRLVEQKDHKKNPAIYRVLGDSLMRTGKLQQALDTYRKALNLL
ncbi:MAG: tetratricopeptide repeat protein, partial [Anaerolineae bacterium]|nr:tetratricopeptide repeat protein [Anaerolineae bacterium]